MKGTVVIKVQNIRFGFATNSSSTHSIIIVTGPMCDEIPSERGYEWDWFRLVKPESKLRYLFAQLLSSMRSPRGEPTLDYRTQFAVANHILGTNFDPKMGDEEDCGDFSVDHQSAWRLPRAYGSAMPDPEYVAMIRKELMRDDVVVCGGNDNEDGIPLPNGQPSWIDRDTAVNTEGCPCVCRKDPTYGFWTLFDQRSGTRVRFMPEGEADEEPGIGDSEYRSSRRKEAKPPIERATFPELVDLKITDRCLKGCTYCYQDSKRDGEHANDLHVQWILNQLAEMEVFEVAIGGGEPLEHPDFIPIIEHARSVGIVPSFSTRQTAWLTDDPKLVGAVKKNCGAVGISVEHRDEATHAAALLHTAGFGLNWDQPNRAMLHVIVGGGLATGGCHQPDDAEHYVERETERYVELMNIAAQHHVGILFLGYKAVGRGVKAHRVFRGCQDHEAITKEELQAWFKAVSRVQNRGGSSVYQIGIDTTLAAAAGDELKKLGVHAALYDTHEGRFSCYVDAVKNRVGPCSYGPTTPFELYPEHAKSTGVLWLGDSIRKIMAGEAMPDVAKDGVKET